MSSAVMPDRLRALLHSILPSNRFYSGKYSSQRLEHLTLQDLPLTTKSELIADQRLHPQYGTNLTFPRERFTRMHQTSGTTSGQPLRWLDTPESWKWMLNLWRSKFAMMGLRPDDRLYFPFSFGPFLGFWAAFEAAVKFGYFTLPGGGMSSAARLRFLIEHGITVIFCTPSYALHLAEVAAANDLDLIASPVRMLIAAGEPGASIPATRQRIESLWGARLFDHYGLTEVGPAACECHENPGSMHVMDEEYIAEIIDPATTLPVPLGTVGELVITNLGRVGSPLIRYRTGDLVRGDASPCPCGRPWLRLAGGVLGRTDDMIHLRGNNLYPAALEGVVRRFADVAEFLVTLDRTGPQPEISVAIEPIPSAVNNGVTERVARAIRDELFVRATVTEAPPGALPRFELKAKRFVKKD